MDRWPLRAAEAQMQDSALHTLCHAEFSRLGKLRRADVFVKYDKMEEKSVQNPSPIFLIIHGNSRGMKISNYSKIF